VTYRKGIGRKWEMGRREASGEGRMKRGGRRLL
jgi:hypothetical protein